MTDEGRDAREGEKERQMERGREGWMLEGWMDGGGRDGWIKEGMDEGKERRDGWRDG